MRSLKNKKAGLILEQVFIVIFGIMILITVFLVFQEMRSQSSEVIANEQFENIALYVHNGVIMALNSMSYSDYGEILLKLPPTLGGRSYSVAINNTTILVRDSLSDFNRSVPIYSLEGISLSGTASSGGGMAYVIYNTSGSEITLMARYPVPPTTIVPPSLRPGISWVNVTPDNPTPSDNLNCSFYVVDSDNTSVLANITWYNGSINLNEWDENDKSVSNATETFVDSAPLNNSTEEDETWYCQVTVWDAANGSDAKNGSETIQASVVTPGPVITYVNVIPDSPTTSDNLNCTFVATNPDNATFPANITWYNGSTQLTEWDENDITVYNNTEMNASKAPTSFNTSLLETWYCQVTVWDEDGSDSQNGSETITMGPVLLSENEGPTATAYSKQPKIVRAPSGTGMLHVIYYNESINRNFHRNSSNNGINWSSEHTIQEAWSTFCEGNTSLGINSSDGLIVVCKSSSGTFTSDNGTDWVQTNTDEMGFTPSLFIQSNYTAHVLLNQPVPGREPSYRQSNDWGATWYAALTVNNSCSVAQPCADALLAQDNTGVLYAFWSMSEVIAPELGDRDVFFSYCNNSNVSCIYSASWAIADVVYNTSVNTTPGDAVVTDDNVVHLVGTTNIGGASEEVFYTNYTYEGSWGTPINLSSTSSNDSEASISTNGSALHVIWQKELTNTTLYYSSSTDYTSWSTPINLTGNNELNDTYVSTIYKFTSNILGYIWTEKQADSTYDVYYNYIGTG